MDLTYITSRGRWYHASWKGEDSEVRGGSPPISAYHFFDMLTFVFGAVTRQRSASAR